MNRVRKPLSAASVDRYVQAIQQAIADGEDVTQALLDYDTDNRVERIHQALTLIGQTRPLRNNELEAVTTALEGLNNG